MIEIYRGCGYDASSDICGDGILGGKFYPFTKVVFTAFLFRSMK